MLCAGGDHHLLPLCIGQRMAQPLRARLAMSRMTAIGGIVEVWAKSVLLAMPTKAPRNQYSVVSL